jgi:hypothetical protein
LGEACKGDKALAGDSGFRRYLKTISEEYFAIDPDKIEAEKKFDGIFVLRTNTDLNPLEAMLCYKQLSTVEQTSRTAKHLLASRPGLPQAGRDCPRSRVLQLARARAEVGAGGRIACLGRSGSWPEIIADLDSLTKIEIECAGKRLIAGSAPLPAASWPCGQPWHSRSARPVGCWHLRAWIAWALFSSRIANNKDYCGGKD